MEIVVIDGQGGGIGKNIIQVLKEKHQNILSLVLEPIVWQQHS